MVLAALGLGGEAGEVVDIIKKATFHPGYEIDDAHLKEECGDVLWYLALLFYTKGWTFREVIQGNVEKLLARYPERFTWR